MGRINPQVIDGAQVGLRERDDWLDPTVSTKSLDVTPLGPGHCFCVVSMAASLRCQMIFNNKINVLKAVFKLSQTKLKRPYKWNKFCF